MKNISILILMLISIESFCQRKNIGDKLSSVKFSNLVNSNFKDFDLKKSKSKLLLLDFWSIGCKGCISSMKTLAELKEKWKDDLDIILLSLNDTASLNKFFKKKPDVKALNLPMVHVGKTWQEWFPFMGVPHVVWIGADHKVKAITYSSLVTDQNIETYMRYGEISLPEKIFLPSFDNKKSLLISKYEQPVFYSSFFSGPVEGLRASFGNRKMDGNQYKLFSHNQSIRAMYFHAYQYLEFLKYSNYSHRIIFDISDASLLEKDKWGIEKRFCYELTMPLQTFKNPKHAVEFFKNDLNRFFGTKTEIIRKPTEVFILGSVDTTNFPDQLSTKETLTEYYIAGIEAPKLLNILEIILPTGSSVFYDGPLGRKVTVTLKTQYNRLEDLQTDLGKAGLTLDKEIREIEFLLVQDNYEPETRNKSGRKANTNLSNK